MKTFVRLIRRYVLAAVGIVLLLVFLGLGLLMFLGWQETTHLPQRTYASSEIADAMVETPAGLALGAAHTPEEWMDGYAWAMVLDDTGNIRWSYALPDALNHAYTTGEVAGFARWYLDDYPVFCWAEDYGLFVIGLARGSLWKYSIYTSPEYILSLAKTAHFKGDIAVSDVLTLRGGCGSQRQVHGFAVGGSGLGLGDDLTGIDRMYRHFSFFSAIGRPAFRQDMAGDEKRGIRQGVCFPVSLRQNSGRGGRREEGQPSGKAHQKQNHKKDQPFLRGGFLSHIIPSFQSLFVFYPGILFTFT